MADQLQLRGGPTAQSETFVGAEREITVDTGLKRLRIHDGVTPGGHLLTGKVDLDAAIAVINQAIADQEALDAQERAALKASFEQGLADQEALDAAARAQLQEEIDAEAAASAAYDIIQDNRMSVLELLNDINKKELNYITLVGTAGPAPGQVGVNSFAPSGISMIVLPKTDADGKTIAAGDFLEGDRIGLKQDHGAAGIFFVEDAFSFGDHIRINVDDSATILGAGGDLAFIENDSINAVFEDTTVTRSVITAGLEAEATARAAETTAREAAIASLTDLITALQDRAAALELDAVTQTYVDDRLSSLVNGADAALDTLKEIGDALAAGDTNVTDALTATITTEGTTRAAADTALSNRLGVLESDPTTQTLLNAESAARVAAIEAEAAARVAAIAAEETTRIAGDAAEAAARSAAITTEETARTAADAATLTSANSYTDTQVATGDATVTNAMTALVTTEAATRGAADSALSARIAVLEADPTTATALTAAVAGVQADVDQNEADSDAAIAAEEARALTAEASITASLTALVTAEETRALAAEAVLTAAITTEETRATAAEASITATHTADEAARNQLNLHAGLAFGQLYVGDLVVA